MSLTSYQAAPPRNLALPTGGAGGSRTHNPQIRSLMLYPVELQPHFGKRGIVYQISLGRVKGVFYINNCPQDHTGHIARNESKSAYTPFTHSPKMALPVTAMRSAAASYCE